MLFLNDINRLVWQFTIIVTTITATTATTNTSSIITVELFLDLLEQLVELVTTTSIVYSTSIKETQENVKTSELLVIVVVALVVVVVSSSVSSSTFISNASDRNVTLVVSPFTLAVLVVTRW